MSKVIDGTGKLTPTGLPPVTTPAGPIVVFKEVRIPGPPGKDGKDGLDGSASLPVASEPHAVLKIPLTGPPTASPLSYNDLVDLPFIPDATSIRQLAVEPTVRYGEQSPLSVGSFLAGGQNVVLLSTYDGDITLNLDVIPSSTGQRYLFLKNIGTGTATIHPDAGQNVMIDRSSADVTLSAGESAYLVFMYQIGTAGDPHVEDTNQNWFRIF